MHPVGKYRLICVLLGTALLTACGGGGGSDPVVSTPAAPLSLSGVVADGYLENATVCSDRNLNKQCDTGEPSATTDYEGTYTLVGDDLDLYPLVVEITADTTDQDAPTKTLKPYVMTAPIPADLAAKQVVTPITTLVQNRIETDPTLNRTQAADLVKQDLGFQPAAAVDMFEDFVGKDGQDYQLMHATARVIADSMGASQEALKAAAEVSGLTYEQVKAEIVKLVVDNVMTQLQTITTSVKTAQEAAVQGGGTFDPAAFETSSVTVEAASVENIAEDIDSAKAKAVPSSFKTALDGGFYWLDARADYDRVELGYGIVTVTGTNADTLAEEVYEFDSATGQWVTEVNEADSYLTATGWVETAEGPAGETITFNADQTVTITDPVTGFTSTIKMTIKELAGLSMRAVLGKDAAFVLKDATAVFPAGAKAYKLSFTHGQDQYAVNSWMQDGIDHNRISTWNGSVEQTVTSLNDVPTLFAYSPGNYNFLWIEDGGLQLADGGVLKVFSRDSDGQMVEVAAGSYETVTVHGQELLMLHVPASFKSWPNETSFLTEKDGMVKTGYFVAGGSIDFDDQFAGNQTAFDALLSKLNIDGVADLNSSGIASSGSFGNSWVQARNYEDPSRASDSKAYITYANLTHQPLSSIISQVEWTDGTNSLGTLTAPDQESYLFYNCLTGNCFEQKTVIAEPYYWFSATGALAAGSYEFETTLSADSTILTTTVDYPGDLQLPVIDSSTQTASWNATTGNLDLEWTLPTGSNIDAFNQLRAVIQVPNNEQLQRIYIKLPANASTVSLPAALLEPLGVTPDSNVNNARWTMQTRAYDAAGKNNARGISNSVELPGATTSETTPPGTTPPVAAMPFSASDLSGKILYNVWPDSTMTGGWGAATISFASDGSASGDDGILESFPSAPAYANGAWSIDNQGFLVMSFPGEVDNYIRLVSRSTEFMEVCWEDSPEAAAACTQAEYFYTSLAAVNSLVATPPQ